MSTKTRDKLATEDWNDPNGAINLVAVDSEAALLHKRLGTGRLGEMNPEYDITDRAKKQGFFVKTFLSRRLYQQLHSRAPGETVCRIDGMLYSLRQYINKGKWQMNRGRFCCLNKRDEIISVCAEIDHSTWSQGMLIDIDD